MRGDVRIAIARHHRTQSPRGAAGAAGGAGNLLRVPALDASAALTQEVEIDLFQGPFDLLLVCTGAAAASVNRWKRLAQ